MGLPGGWGERLGVPTTSTTRHVRTHLQIEEKSISKIKFIETIDLWKGIWKWISNNWIFAYFDDFHISYKTYLPGERNPQILCALRIMLLERYDVAERGGRMSALPIPKPCVTDPSSTRRIVYAVDKPCFRVANLILILQSAALRRLLVHLFSRLESQSNRLSIRT